MISIWKRRRDDKLAAAPAAVPTAVFELDKCLT